MIRVGLIWSAAILTIMLGASLYGWTILPEGAEFPVHWNAAGEVDGYGGKFEALLMMPLITIPLILLMVFLPKRDPRMENLQKSKPAYLAGWIGSVGIMGAVHLMTVYSALGGKVPVTQLVVISIGVLFIVLGNYLTKTRSNWFVGLRTPWTLSSEHAWSIGNRYLGRGFLVTGIVTIFSAIFASQLVAFSVLAAGTLITTIGSIVASYFAWKHDPDVQQEH